MTISIMKIELMKHATKMLEIAKIKDPEFFYVPLSQHIGQVSAETVKKGDHVKKFEVIGTVQGNVSSFIHSPVSGEIADIIDNPLPNGKLARTVVIKNDFKDSTVTLRERKIGDLESYRKNEILEIIKNKGIVGEGGAQFPTHVKYDIKDKSVDTFILNGAECEPYLTSDYSVMNTFAEEIFGGIEIVKKLISPKEIVIGIEDENRELEDVFKKFIKESDNIRVQILPTAYPQGSELQLIRAVTGKSVKKGALPVDSGIIVSNVSTVKSVYDAFIKDIPLVERVVTVSGEKIQKAGNYLIKTGTTLGHIREQLSPDEDAQIIFGGPMMGTEVLDDKTPVIKGTSGILFLEAENIERVSCISCGYCVDVCPMGLMPFEFADFYKKEKYRKLEKAGIQNCIECGACEYACPSRVPLIESIKNGKAKISERGGKQ